VGAASTPRVDVGVVTWNTRDLTVEALRRLLDTPTTCELRLLVRDNASTDGTADAIASRVPEAELDRGDANLGFAGGVNTILARSDAPWFLALNSDAWPEPGAIDRMVAIAERHPRAAAVAPRLERPDGELEHSTHRFPSVGLAVAAALGPAVIGRRRARELLLEGPWGHDEPCEVDWAVGAALLLRRAALDELGGLDERYFMYVEDLEWCWRARRAGWAVRFEPGAVVRHVGNASGAQAYGDRRTAEYLRNTYRFYRSTHGPLSTAALRAGNLAGAVRLWAQGRVRGDDDMARHWRSQLPVHLRGR
jgi:N-acetylglucosaminyl-diphospho-decaprenol L-rhamnosyltransferase